MQRLDVYTMIHKGLRTVMFETARQVARADFTQDRETRETTAGVRRLIEFLDEHAAHEDHVVMPEIAGLSPAVFAELEADHSRVGGLQREIEELCERVEQAEGEERVSLGRRLHQRMGHLTAEHLLHMEREETTANRVLWAHRTDADLLALRARIEKTIPPQRMEAFGQVLIPSINPTERAALLTPVQA